MTTTRSAICATTAMSCVMNITAVPVSRFNRSISARISAWIVTSSAVVGSSAISSRGSHASAIAITTRWRMPPDNSCGYWCRRRSGSGMRTCRSNSSARASAALWFIPMCSRSPSVSCRPTVKTGFSAVIGSWKIMPISLPRIVRIRSWSAVARFSTPSPSRSKSSRPPAIVPPPYSIRRISDREETDLPDPLSPTTQTVSPGPMSKDTSSTPTTVPSLVWNSTRRPSICAIGRGPVSSSIPASPWIDRSTLRPRRQHCQTRVHGFTAVSHGCACIFYKSCFDRGHSVSGDLAKIV